MGREDAKELAVALIAAYEGIALLAATLRDPSLISAEGDRLNRWIDSLTETRMSLQ
jgi:TetR/AcrR family transcriptional regulator, transcriptional repressor for nem operon